MRIYEKWMYKLSELELSLREFSAWELSISELPWVGIAPVGVALGWGFCEWELSGRQFS